MNSKQLHDMPLGYPVTICTADHIKIQKGRFVIFNMYKSQCLGEHWMTFYFPKWCLYNCFLLLGHMLEDYAARFEIILNKKYPQKRGQLQQSTSNLCRLYLAYYVMNQHLGKHERHPEILLSSLEDAK